MIYKEIFTFIWFVRNMSQCIATPVAPASQGRGPHRHHHVCGRAIPAWRTGWSWSLTLDEETSWCMFPEMAWSYYSFKSAHLYAMLHIWISINELFQDWNCNVYFLPCSDEQNTPKRHIYQRGQRVLTTLFSLPFTFLSLFVIYASPFHFAFRQRPVRLRYLLSC